MLFRSAAHPSPPFPAATGPRWRRFLHVAVLGILQALAAFEIMILIVMAAFAVMIFDAPGSTERIENWLFFIGMSLLPVVALVLCAVAWGLHCRGRPRWAIATLAGVVLAGLLAVILALGPGPLW